MSRSLAPATDAIEYEAVKFHSGPLNNEEDDIYSLPPSPKVDQAWRDLYESEYSDFSHLSFTQLSKWVLYGFPSMLRQNWSMKLCRWAVYP